MGFYLIARRKYNSRASSWNAVYDIRPLSSRRIARWRRTIAACSLDQNKKGSFYESCAQLHAYLRLMILSQDAVSICWSCFDTATSIHVVVAELQTISLDIVARCFVNQPSLSHQYASGRAVQQVPRLGRCLPRVPHTPPAFYLSGEKRDAIPIFWTVLQQRFPKCSCKISSILHFDI